mgnify:CR=1 FL=1
MALEVELKARVDNITELRESLDSLGIFEGEYRKEDIYYGWSREPLFRLRRQGGLGVVTLKDKSIVDGIEESREIEFHVDEPGDFARFAAALSYQEVVRKVKVGARFNIDGVTVELSMVEEIGRAHV